MNISRIKFVIIFLISGFVFLFISNALFGTEASLFPGNDESFLGADSAVTWKSVGYTVLLPIKIVLIGPLLPYIEFLRQDPDTPPPFFLVGFILYWSLLALFVHYVLGKIKQRKSTDV